MRSLDILRKLRDKLSSFIVSFRAPFEILEVWLEGLAMHYTVGAPLPSNLLVDIYNYNGKDRE